MGRSERQKEIIRLITEREINTQNELVEALREGGYDVTQATVSRDINELGLIKVPGRLKKVRYAPHNNDKKMSKLSTLFKESVISMNTAMNMIVIKTFDGSANAACLLLDKLNLPNIVGTLAGDDTILVIAKSVEAVPDIYRLLKEFV